MVSVRQERVLPSRRGKATWFVRTVAYRGSAGTGELPWGAWVTYVGLLRSADGRGRVEDGQRELADRAGLPKTTLHRGLKHLIESGWVQIERQPSKGGADGGGRPAVYRLLYRTSTRDPEPDVQVRIRPWATSERVA